jgi:hypothetical protein
MIDLQLELSRVGPRSRGRFEAPIEGTERLGYGKARGRTRADLDAPCHAGHGSLAGRLSLLYEPRYSMPATVFLYSLLPLISPNPFTSRRQKASFRTD